MRLYTLLAIASCAISTHAATVPRPAVPDLEKKLTEVAKEVLKDDKPIPNDASEQELIQVNGVSDIANNLRNDVHNIKNIPVKVVAAKPLLKNYGIEKGNDVVPEDVNVKREEVDLKNPGPPQRQEHDTQSPEDSNLEQEAINAIKQSIIYTQDNLKQGFNQIKQGVDSLSNEKLPSIQQSIANLQETFLSQISKLNQTIQSYLPSSSEAAINNVEKNLEIVEQKFEDGVESLSKGLLSFGSVKQDSTGTDTTNPAGSGIGGNFANVLQSIQASFGAFQTNIQNQVTNLQQSMQNVLNQIQQGQGSTASGTGPGSIVQNLGSGIQSIVGQENTNKPDDANAQSDTPDRPGIGQGIQNFFQGIWNRPGAAQGASQNQQNPQADSPTTSAPGTQPGPIVQAIQSNPIYQGVVNLIQRPQAANNKPQSTPAKAPDAEAANSGLNVVPAETSDPKPVKEEKQKPTVGPIQQIVQRNPIVQGIAGVAQRIQHTVSNPEKPREVERYGHYHKPSSTASGDSDISVDSSGVESDISKAVEEQKVVKDTEKEIQPNAQEIKEEKVAVAAKTE